VVSTAEYTAGWEMPPTIFSKKEGSNGNLKDLLTTIDLKSDDSHLEEILSDAHTELVVENVKPVAQIE